VNKNLSEFENKLPSVLEYDTQQLLDYYYESPEKMKIAEVFSEFLIEKGIKVELKEIGEYQYIHEIETGYYLLPLFVGGGTTDKKMSVSINIHLFHEKYFPEGMKNWNGSQMNLNYKDSLIQAFENWFNYDRLNYLKLINPDKTDLRRIEINGKKKIIVGATGASGLPLLIECLKLIRRAEGFSSILLMTRSAKLTLQHESDMKASEAAGLADETFGIDEIGAGPASGSYHATGMLIVPCSMKTLAGICSGYADNLLLRAADVMLKEKRPLVLAVRESPLSAIHLRNMHELSLLPTVHIVPPMMVFYNHPRTLEEMLQQVAARLLAPFGLISKEYRCWQGLSENETEE